MYRLTLIILNTIFKLLSRLNPPKQSKPINKPTSTLSIPPIKEEVPTEAILKPTLPEVKHTLPPIKINQQFLTKHTRPALSQPDKYQIIELVGFVVHWTANKRKGADAQANRNYFQRGRSNKGKKIHASAHYIIDDKQIIQCLPDNEVGYHVGDRPKGKYTPKAVASIQKHIKAFKRRFGEKAYLTPNFFYIGLEICVNDYADIQKAIDNTQLLIAYKLEEHGQDKTIERHYDLTYKPCPKLPIPEHITKKNNRKFELLKRERWEEFKNKCRNYPKV